MAKPRVYRKQDGTFSATVTIRRRGYPTMTETFTEDTRKEAEIAAKAWAYDIERRMQYKRMNDPRAGRVKLQDAFALYFAHQELTQRKAASTIRGEKWNSQLLLEKLGADIFLSEITTSRMARYRDDRLHDGVGPSKIRTELALVSCLFKYAIQEHGIPLENPVASGKMWRPKAPKGKTAFLSTIQIDELIVACKQSPSRGGKLPAYVLVMLQTGMRPGEAAQLKVNMVDMQRRSIRLVITKNGDPRLIQLTDAAFQELVKHIAGKEHDDYIFYDGKTLPKNYQHRPASLFRGPFDAAKKAAGLSWLTRHDLRHTAATHMLKNGVELRVIAEALGHRTLEMAMKYTHPDEETMRNAWNTLGDLGSSALRAGDNG